MNRRTVRGLLLTAGLIAAAPVVQAGGQDDGWRCANTPDNPLVAINYCVRAIYSGDLSQDQLAATFYNRGFAYGKNGDMDLAIKDFKAAIDLRPGFDAAYNSLAVAYLDKGEGAVAIEAVSLALEKTPDDVPLLRHRAMLRLNQGEAGAALSDIEAAFRIAPDDPENALWRFIIQYSNGIVGMADLSQFAVNRDLNAWPGPVIAMFLGMIKPQALAEVGFRAADDGDWRLQCEALFYVGQFQYMRGAKANAAQFLRAAINTGATGVMAYSAARSVLGGL